MSTFGGAAISQFIAGNEVVANAALELQHFKMLEGFPLTAITSFIGIVLVIVFFVTSLIGNKGNAAAAKKRSRWLDFMEIQIMIFRAGSIVKNGLILAAILQRLWVET